MKFLKRVGAWFKKYWYVALTFVAAGLSLLFLGKKSDTFLAALTEQRKDDKDRAVKLEKIHDKQISERDNHIDEHAESLKKIDEEHSEKLEAIESKKDDMVSDLKKSDDLASELDKEFDL